MICFPVNAVGLAFVSNRLCVFAILIAAVLCICSNRRAQNFGGRRWDTGVLSTYEPEFKNCYTIGALLHITPCDRLPQNNGIGIAEYDNNRNRRMFIKIDVIL